MNKAILIVFLVLFGCFSTLAKEENTYHKITKENWKKATKDFDYAPIKELEKKKKKKKDNTNWSLPTFNSTLAQILFYTLVGGVLILILYILIKNISPENSKVNRNTLYKKLDEEENIKEMNLDEYLASALSLNDFALAMRVKYLMLLKELNIKNYIKWSKEKTNGEYLNELVSQKCYYDFSKITLSFEIAWYGEHEVDANDYENISREFDKINNLIKNG